MAQIWVVNGRIRLRTDVLAFAIGALTLGLLTATAATLALALPVFILLDVRARVTMASTLGAGAAIGAAVGIVFWIWTSESLLLGPVKGALVGLMTSACWWWLCKRESSSLKQRVAT